MTVPMTETVRRPRRLLRSVIAVFAGFLAILVLSIGTDQIFHSLGLYPPWGKPMHDTGLNILALAYRSVYAVIGSYIAASLAPRAPMGHALALGVVGVVLGTMGAIAAWEMSPSWFLIVLVLVALPCAWLGGALHRMRQ